MLSGLCQPRTRLLHPYPVQSARRWHGAETWMTSEVTVAHLADLVIRHTALTLQRQHEDGKKETAPASWQKLQELLHPMGAPTEADELVQKAAESMKGQTLKPGQECQACGAVATQQPLKQCTGCRIVSYCSFASQRADWKAHKHLFSARNVLAAGDWAVDAQHRVGMLTASYQEDGEKWWRMIYLERVEKGSETVAVESPERQLQKRPAAMSETAGLKQLRDYCLSLNL